MAEQRFSAPIPGMAMTRELGSRPWQRPPQYSTIEDVSSFYTARFKDPLVQDSILNAVETNVPLVSIANSLQTIGVMEGKHSIDLGVLVSPIIIELMKVLAKAEGVEFNGDLDDKEKIEESRNLSAMELAAVKSDETINNVDQPMSLDVEEEILPENAEDEARGLMSRRMVQ
jgi:hypothetical protein|tara:strand:- start:1326 stop:1841 length:516 start_codon:yes stop_codon:yes gene_type:complete